MAVTQKPRSSTARKASPTETFQSLNPATGEVVATFPMMGADEVAAVVASAHEASAWWQELGFDGRKAKLKAFRREIARGVEELCNLVHEENGKPYGDAFLEVLLSVDHLAWAAGHAGKVLDLHKVPSSLLAMNYASYVEYQPFGVIGVIGPWNYPVFTPMGSIAYALAAGNAVVFKPSEYTPAVGKWLEAAFARAVPERPEVFQVVTGLGATGGALCTSGVGKIAFTGSARTGRKVMAQCAENLVPVLMELGGKDAMIVDDDADIDDAAQAAVWGGLQNAGQACISVERVYVTEKVYEPFVAKVKELAMGLRAGEDGDAAIGPITMPGQRDIIAAHLADAFDRGATAIVGGRDAVRGAYVDPVVLVDVPEESSAMREETFGPTLPIVRVRDADEALRRANNTSYGLAATVFARKRGMEIARKIRSGMTSINSVVTFASVPSLPFGGVGDSGFGRIHGPDGLKEFTHAKAITRKRFNVPLDFQTFARDPRLVPRLTRLMKLMHGRG